MVTSDRFFKKAEAIVELLGMSGWSIRITAPQPIDDFQEERRMFVTLVNGRVGEITSSSVSFSVDTPQEEIETMLLRELTFAIYKAKSKCGRFVHEARVLFFGSEKGKFPTREGDTDPRLDEETFIDLVKYYIAIADTLEGTTLSEFVEESVRDMKNRTWDRLEAYYKNRKAAERRE